MFFFLVRWYLITVRNVFREEQILETEYFNFFIWIFSFSALAHKIIKRKCSSRTSPSFSPYGYWFANLFRILAFCSIEKRKGFGSSDWQWGGRLPSLALTARGVVVRIQAHQQSKALQCDNLAAFWSPSAAPAWSSSLWQRSSMLKPFPGAALHAQQSLFTCAFLSGSGFVPYIVMSFVLPGAAWF